MSQYGGGCSLCGAEGTNKSTCPLNPLAKNPSSKHRSGTPVQRTQVRPTPVQRTQVRPTPVQRTQVRPTPVPFVRKDIKYVPVKVKKSASGNERLSARWYYDSYGDESIGDRCKSDGDYKCLLVRSNGSPHWAAKAKNSKLQGACEDWSPRCRVPDYN